MILYYKDVPFGAKFRLSPNSGLWTKTRDGDVDADGRNGGREPPLREVIAERCPTGLSPEAEERTETHNRQVKTRDALQTLMTASWFGASYEEKQLRYGLVMLLSDSLLGKGQDYERLT
jgi:hypothetical protein